ncbi:DUF4307 domain-containing protein [Kocuria flava]|uniref:DUF4307 domain-containing protein n=1 Tax=Kocuria flava TaxID=446860 RepID=UPI001FF5F332|nr:DUF4307 domain-containing protein [Kocuria flava]MCJ8504520.1 DUF4307 domain-containing protein [Kocuria flava]
MSTDSPDLLRSRYGAPRRDRRIGRRGWIALVAAATLLAAAFAVWVLGGQQRQPTFKDIGFQVLSEARATADFDLTKHPDDVVTCAVQALNEEYAVVGWTEVTVGALPREQLHEGRTSSHRAELRTTNLATTAVVDSCWIDERGGAA